MKRVNTACAVWSSPVATPTVSLLRPCLNSDERQLNHSPNASSPAWVEAALTIPANCVPLPVVPVKAAVTNISPGTMLKSLVWIWLTVCCQKRVFIPLTGMAPTFSCSPLEVRTERTLQAITRSTVKGMLRVRCEFLHIKFVASCGRVTVDQPAFTLWRSAGGVDPISIAGLGGPGGKLDQFLLNEFLLSRFSHGDALAPDLTARRSVGRCDRGQGRLRNHTGRIDPLAH